LTTQEKRKPIELREEVERTIAMGSARFLVAARRDNPLPEAIDHRGEGVVDFARDRIWMRDRLLTERIDAERRQRINILSRPGVRLIQAFARRLVGSGRDLYFEGGALWIRKKNGEWGQPLGNVADAKYARHPLCILDPVALADTVSPVTGESEIVQGSATSRYALELTAAQFDSSLWAEIAAAANGAPREAIQAFIWLDDQGRIRRLSYEASCQQPDLAPLWYMTEFWEFGIAIDRRTPHAASTA
jgi:hypothetical protein